MSKVRTTGIQLITTKYFGPTQSKGARIKASCLAGTAYKSWDYELTRSENHVAAVEALLARLSESTNSAWGEIKWVGALDPTKPIYQFVGL